MKHSGSKQVSWLADKKCRLTKFGKSYISTSTHKIIIGVTEIMKENKETEIISSYTNRKVEDLYEEDRHQEVWTLRATLFGKHIQEFRKNPKAFIIRLLEADGKKVNKLIFKSLEMKKAWFEDYNIQFECRSYHQITPKKDNSTYIIVCKVEEYEMPKRIPW